MFGSSDLIQGKRGEGGLVYHRKAGKRRKIEKVNTFEKISRISGEVGFSLASRSRRVSKTNHQRKTLMLL